MSLFSSSITTSHAKSIWSVVIISITDTYDPETGRVRMTLSARQTSCVGVAMAQDFVQQCRLRRPIKYVKHIFF